MLYWLIFPSKQNVASSLNTILAVNFSLPSTLGKVTAKLTANLSWVVTYCNSWYLPHLSWKFQQNFVHCCGWRVYLSRSLPGWFAQTANESRTIRTYTTFSKPSSPTAFTFTNSASSIKIFIPLVSRHSCSRLPFKHRTKTSLQCNHRPRLGTPKHTSRFIYFRRHFNNCECSASSGNACKLKWHVL
jgi:hypothetical protein